MDIEKLKSNLQSQDIDLSFFETATEAKEYLLSQIHNTTVGIGGSKTIDSLDLYEPLCESNKVYWHWKDGSTPEVFQGAEEAEVYLTSINAVAETGELVNIDGRGNRVASMVYGNDKTVYIIAGVNKVCSDFESALWRARNIAAPQNLVRLPGKRPCAVTKKCMDCRSPDRLCNVLLVLYGKPMDMKKLELVLINQELGF